MASPVKPAWRFLPPPPEEQGSPGFGNVDWFKTWAINPPGARYITRDDQLLVRNLWTINLGNAVVRFRMITADARIVEGNYIIPTGNANAINTNLFQLAEGFLLSVTVENPNAGFGRGRLFVEVAIARGTLIDLRVEEVLISEYVSSGFNAAWPGGMIRMPEEGPGVYFSVNQGNPAAGADFAFSIPTLTRKRLVCLRAVLTTSAVVATRNARLVIDDSVNIVAQLPPSGTQAASLVGSYTAGGGFAGNTTNNDLQWPLPELPWLPTAWRIRSLTAGIDVGDQWSAIWFLFENVESGG